MNYLMGKDRRGFWDFENMDMKKSDNKRKLRKSDSL